MSNAVSLVNAYLEEIENCAPAERELVRICEKHLAPAAVFKTGQPTNILKGHQAVAMLYWQPLRRAFSNFKRVNHIMLDGACAVTGETWVATTGRYVGNFKAPLHGIPPTHGAVQLRFGEFYQVKGNKISAGFCLLDYLQLMHHAGVYFLPPALGGHPDVTAPQSGDGLQSGERNERQSEQSLLLALAMLAELLVDKKNHLAQPYWAEHMTWYGPAGIGTFHTLAGFKSYREAFLNSFPDRIYGAHEGVIAKNNYVAVASWNGVIATHLGEGWLGLPPTGKRIAMRLMDFWRVEKEQLVENWVLIDLVDVFYQLGVPLFKNLRRLTHQAYFKTEEEEAQRFEAFLKKAHQNYHHSARTKEEQGR